MFQHLQSHLVTLQEGSLHVFTDVLLCQLPLGLGSIHSIAGDGCQLLTAVVFIVDIVGDVLQILHMGPVERKENMTHTNMVSEVSKA